MCTERKCRESFKMLLAQDHSKKEGQTLWRRYQRGGSPLKDGNVLVKVNILEKVILPSPPRQVVAAQEINFLSAKTEP